MCPAEPELNIHHLYVERPRTYKLSHRRWIQRAGFSCYAIDKVNPLGVKLCLNAQYILSTVLASSASFPIYRTCTYSVVPIERTRIPNQSVMVKMHHISKTILSQVVSD